MIRYLDVCAGISASTVAWRELGWEAAAYSEIEAAPRAVLAKHYPDTPLHGDFTTIEGDEYGPIDLLVGGTPCQDFSVAGLRAGMAGDRGNLTLEYGRLAYRTGARWLAWENVPGVFSSNGGADFGAVLACFAGYPLGQFFAPPTDGGWRNAGIVAPANGESFGLAWRVLDAQFAGVPQRRRRVFIVGYLGNWQRAAAVLFERHSLSWNTPPRRKAGQGFAAELAPSLTASGRGVERTGETRGQDPVVAVAGAFTANAYSGGAGGRPEGAAAGHFVADVAPTLNAGGNSTGGDRPFGTSADTAEALIAATVSAKWAKGSGGPSGGPSGDECQNLVTVPVPPIAFNSREDPISGDVFGALGSGHPQAQAVAYDLRGREGGAQFEGPHDTANIRAADGGSSRSYVQAVPISQDAMRGEGTALTPSPDAEGRVRLRDPGFGVGKPGDPAAMVTSAAPGGVAFGSAVRRLTPRECERLQGFPDDYTLVPRGKGFMADGPRYKALGNSMAVPVMRWLGERIAMVEELGL